MTCVTTVCSSSGPIREADDDPVLVELARAVLADPVAARDRVREHATHVLGDRTWVTRMTEQFNPQVFDAPLMRELYERSWNEGTAVSVEGYVDDWIVRRRPYEFELSDIDVPVFVWFGEQDVLCPRWHADALIAVDPHQHRVRLPRLPSLRAHRTLARDPRPGHRSHSA